MEFFIKNRIKKEEYKKLLEHLPDLLAYVVTFKKTSTTTKNEKKCFLTACKIWDRKFNLEEFDQNFPHGGLIGYGNSIQNFFLSKSKVLHLHAILNDSAGAVKATTNGGLGYCYMLPQTPSSCLLGHITGLFFCIYVKICHPRNFQKLDCWSTFEKFFQKIECHSSY